MFEWFKRRRKSAGTGDSVDATGEQGGDVGRVDLSDEDAAALGMWVDDLMIAPERAVARDLTAGEGVDASVRERFLDPFDELDSVHTPAQSTVDLNKVLDKLEFFLERLDLDLTVASSLEDVTSEETWATVFSSGYGAPVVERIVQTMNKVVAARYADIVPPELNFHRLDVTEAIGTDNAGGFRDVELAQTILTEGYALGESYSARAHLQGVGADRMVGLVLSLIALYLALVGLLHTVRESS